MWHVKLEGEERRVRQVTKDGHGASGKTTIFREAQLRIKNIAIETAKDKKSVSIEYLIVSREA